MKIKYFLALVLTVALAALGAACSQTANNSAMNGMNHNSMNSNSMNMNGMNHNSMPMNSNMPMNHSSMQSSPNAASQPYDLQFIDTMIAHHTSALDMARLAATNTNNPELKKFATQIFDDQTKEINQMKEWREKWFAGKPQAVNMEMPGMRESMQMEMTALDKARDKDFDAEFIRLMIPHHNGAVLMAKEALTKSEKPEIKTLAGNIIKAQEAEIKMMKEWKTKWSK